MKYPLTKKHYNSVDFIRYYIFMLKHILAYPHDKDKNNTFNGEDKSLLTLLEMQNITNHIINLIPSNDGI